MMVGHKRTGSKYRWALLGAAMMMLVAIAGIVSLFSAGTSDDDRLISPAEFPVEPALNARAPGFALQTTEGDTLYLSDYQGQPILVIFWATWCGPCRIEMPAFQDRYERFKDDGLAVLAVNSDEPRQEVLAYEQELGLIFPLLLDPGGEVQRRYRNRSYPTTFFIDRQGIVRAHHIEVLTGGQLDENLAKIGIGR